MVGYTAVGVVRKILYTKIGSIQISRDYVHFVMLEKNFNAVYVKVNVAENLFQVILG